MSVRTLRPLPSSGENTWPSSATATALTFAMIVAALGGLSTPAVAEKVGQWGPGNALSFADGITETEEGPGNKRSSAVGRFEPSLTGARSKRRLSKEVLAELPPRRNGKRVRLASLGGSFDPGRPVASRGRTARNKPGSAKPNEPAKPVAPERVDDKTQVDERVAPDKKETEAKVASLGPAFEVPQPKEALTGAPIAWQANAECLVSSLRSVVESVASLFGPVRVTSTCRPYAHNRRVGGVANSFHLTGSAVDFVVRGDHRRVQAYMKDKVAFIKYYSGGRFHIDNGPALYCPRCFFRSPGPTVVPQNVASGKRTQRTRIVSRKARPTASMRTARRSAGRAQPNLVGG